MHKKGLRVFIALALSVGGLYLALGGVEDFGAVGAVLRGARWGSVVLAVVLMGAAIFLRALRWRALLDDQISVLTAFGLINLGYLISGVLPLRLGDPGRAVAAGLRSPVSALAALSTVVVERTADMVSVALMAAATLPFVAGLSGTAVQGILGGSAAAAILVALVLSARHADALLALARRILERLPLGAPERWLRPLEGILEGLRPLRSPRLGFKVAGLSAGIWAFSTAYFAAVAHALHFDALPGLTAPLALVACVLTWATALGMIAPTPGGIGGFHFVARLALTLGFGLSVDVAVGYGLLGHAISYLMGVLFGALAMAAWGISFRTLQIGEPVEARSLS